MGRHGLVAVLLLLATCEAAEPPPAKPANATCASFRASDCASKTKIAAAEKTHCLGAACDGARDEERCCRKHISSAFWGPFNWLCAFFKPYWDLDPTIFWASVVSLLVVVIATAVMVNSLVNLLHYRSAVGDCAKTQFGKYICFITLGCVFSELNTEIHNHEAQMRRQPSLHEPLLGRDATRSLQKQADQALDNFAVTTRAAMVIILLGFFIQVMSHVRVDSQDTQDGLKVYPTIQMAIHKSAHNNIILIFIPFGFVFLLGAWLTAEYVQQRTKDERAALDDFRKRGALFDNRVNDQSSTMSTMHDDMECKGKYCNKGKLIRIRCGCCALPGKCNFGECPTCNGDSFDYKPRPHDHVYVTDTDFYPEFKGRCGTFTAIKKGSQTQTLSHKVVFADNSERSPTETTSLYGWFRENALVRAKVVDSMHYICVRKPDELSGRYFRDSAIGGAYVHEKETYEIIWHQGRWFWGEVDGQIWFTSFEESLIPPIPPTLKPNDAQEGSQQEPQEVVAAAWQHWQQEISTKQNLQVDFDVYYAHHSKRSSRATQDDDFMEHIMNSYNHTQYAQTSRHKKLTSNSLFFQVVCLMTMWCWPTNDFLPCSFKHNFSDSTSMPAINWTLEAIGIANTSNSPYGLGSSADNPMVCVHTDNCSITQFEMIVCSIAQKGWPLLQNTCHMQTWINTMAWHLLNCCSLWTALRAVWVQGFVSLNTFPDFGPFREGFRLDPLTYFIAFMQVVGCVCYVCFYLAWKNTRCSEDGGMADCMHYCNSTTVTTFQDNAQKIDIMNGGIMHWNPKIGTRIWEETSVVFALLAMFCRVCRDFAVSRGAWQQRYSIFIPFAMLMLHSLVTQNSVVIIPGVTIFVTATFYSASIGKF